LSEWKGLFKGMEGVLTEKAIPISSSVTAVRETYEHAKTFASEVVNDLTPNGKKRRGEELSVNSITTFNRKKRNIEKR